MVASLVGVDLKLRRADRHIAELRDLLEPVGRVAQESIVCETNGDPSKLIYRVSNVPDIDPSASLIMGDALHNLRSALDHLAHQLVIADGGQPNEWTQFPIYDDPLNEKGNPRNVTIQPGIGDQRILDALVLVQPYSRQHPARDCGLWITRCLNNIDKHRLLLTVVHQVDHDMPTWYVSNEGDPEPAVTIYAGPLQVGDRVAEYDFKGAPPPSHFDPNLALAVSISEPEGRWLCGRDIADGLAALRSGIAIDINVHFVPVLNVPYLLSP